MSQYIFLTSDFELPEIDLTNKQNITVEEAKIKGISPPDWYTWDELNPSCEILHFENEDDINNLYIYENYDFIDELRLYTENKYIYMIDCITDKKRVEQLFDYICSINLLNEICIYSIWSGDDAEITLEEVFIDELDKSKLFKIIDSYNCGLIIKNNS